MTETESEDMSQALVDSFRADADAHISDLCRQWARQIVGTNCTWVDDDLRVLAHLADKAVKAGLTDGLPTSMRSSLPSTPNVG